jgi:general secretion pathway protein D
MTPYRISFRSLLAIGLTLLATGTAMAQQARGGNNQGRGNTGATGGGGGGGGGGSGNSNRQYINSTMVGDAMITSDAETRRIIIVTDDATNENIKTVIESLDKPKPQVLINVVFVQVTHGDDLDLGAEATYSGKIAVKGGPIGTATTKFGLAGALADATQYGAFYQISGKNGLDATLHALATKNKTEILSRPSILTRSSQQATILVGQSVPTITNSRISDTTNTTINTVTYQDVGIILRVTPFITQAGMVEMIVSPEISSLSATTVPISNTVNSPVIDRRSADTVVVTPTDTTIAIGGLISTQSTKTENKIPLLGDIPIIGYAFKRTERHDEKTELLIFLTPHVVNDPRELGGLATQERAKLDLTPKTFEKEDMKKYLGNP